MKTHDLIDSLVQEARPVRPLPSPTTLILAFAGATVFVGIAIASIQPRVDLPKEMQGPSLLAETVLLLVAAFAVVLVPIVLTRPDFRGLRVSLYVGAAAVLAAVGVMAFRGVWSIGPSWMAWSGLGLFCGTGAVLFSLVPFAGGIWLLRRGASVHPVRSGMLMGLASSALGSIAEMWSCDINAPLHVIPGHVLLPALILGSIGAWSGSRWLRW